MAASAPALPEDFDLEALLAPIPGELPQGVDLREDTSAQSPWFRLRDQRAEAREIERRAETEGGEETAVAPPWRIISSLARSALLEKSKDLDVAAMLTEAMLRMNGLPGLTAGTLLIKGLAERYWDAVFPLPDEYDGVAARVAGVGGLAGSDREGLLLPPLRRMTLFRRPDGSGLAWYMVEAARDLATLDAERKKQRLEAGALPLETVEAEARVAGAGHFATLRRQLIDASTAWAEMGAKLDELAGADSPSTGRVRDILAEMLAFVRNFAPPEDAPGTEGAAAGGDAGGEEVAGTGGSTGGGGRPMRTREDYLRMLSEIAEYFRRTEPNSPLSYTLDDAARRARLTWPELMAELVPDFQTRTQIITQLGIKPPEEG
ncbi:type VI secretion system protein TssA [Falsiroseomonas sp. HW251]|uniref:type VI secretion system protein TssA n=1 Tax=Falsiroseomonas sp. HW251 TaxID=3390998 RepID=UPI003D31F12A